MIYCRIKDGIDKDKKPKFKILDKDKKVVKNKKILEYINDLIIPPAYDDVKIFYEKNPKILYQGYDDKGRLQQIYSSNHRKKAMKTKFCHLIEFGKKLPDINKDINMYLKKKIITKNKVISLIIKIIMICGFRVGNLKYQKLYNSFGISNILKSHVKIVKNEMIISFTGKKGVKNTCIITDKFLINEIKNIIDNKKPNEYVFTYLDDEKKSKVITALEVNNWIKIYNVNITSKCFRTFDTNVLFIEYVRNLFKVEDPTKTSDVKRKKDVVKAMKIISNQINNSPIICKTQYLHPDILEMYLHNPNKFKKYFLGCETAQKCFLNYLHDFCK